ncbi:MAG: ABC-F family ATP-binding cassette domain-containing protein, partial [Oscillospiraceae bacterium]|nr:ABC-F family ATP-binding cassette domain-containing protein [Oscillospiraceae bacterium]
MSHIRADQLTFSYEGSVESVFENATFTIDTDWKLGLIGRNGKGKTTLLRLLTGELTGQGAIINSVPVAYFPYRITSEQMKLSAAEFADELREGCEMWRVICELSELDEDAEILYRPFETLSHGQRTKALLAILFSGENDFLLLDEPTNHLDAKARENVREYLSSKKGFILVSHDRDLLDACTDHILVLNRKTIMVQSGNFSCWKENQEKRDQFAKSENEKHQKQIKKLRQSAKRTSEWADKSERTKIGYDPIKEHDRPISARAYIGS